jgi:anti-sigma regulatory factor (Ser/Thr protein kinase)
VTLVPAEFRASSDGIDIVLRDIHAGVLLAPTGELSVRSMPAMRTQLEKALADRGRVLVDLTALRVTWAPGWEVFPLALATAGGWPTARLVLFGPLLAQAPVLRAARHLSPAVHLAHDLATAAELLDTRPGRVSRRCTLAAEEGAARWARAMAGQACADWDITEPEVVSAARAVASELVSNVVEHAHTSALVSITLDDRDLRISVRDFDPMGRPEAGRGGTDGTGLGLVVVAGLSTDWGVTWHGYGKAVWAVIRLEE